MASIFLNSVGDQLQRLKEHRGNRGDSVPSGNGDGLADDFSTLVAHLLQSEKKPATLGGLLSQSSPASPASPASNGARSSVVQSQKQPDSEKQLGGSESSMLAKLTQGPSGDVTNLAPPVSSPTPSPGQLGKPVLVSGARLTEPIATAKGPQNQAAPPKPGLIAASRLLAPPQPELPKPKLSDSQPDRLASTEAPAVPKDVRAIIEKEGAYHGVASALGLALAHVESSFDAKAVSADGHRSKGIFQLLDSTGQEMIRRLDVEGPYDPFNPRLNAHLGLGYLKRLDELFSRESTLSSSLKTIPVASAEEREKLAIAAFNAGEGRVARAQATALRLGKDPTNFSAIEAHLPASTREYVERVMEMKKAFTPPATAGELV